MLFEIKTTRISILKFVAEQLVILEISSNLVESKVIFGQLCIKQKIHKTQPREKMGDLMIIRIPFKVIALPTV